MRRGHVTQGQRRAFEQWLPTFGVPYAPQTLDFAQVLGRRAPTVLEIGFGMGETTAAIAQSRPDVDFLGIEVFTAGVGALLKRIDELALTNVRIVHHDAVEVVRDMIAPDSLAGVHVYFPDPWQKKRHHKRRLIAQPFVGMLASRIAPDGYLHCATDWEDYARQMLAVLTEEPQPDYYYPYYYPNYPYYYPYYPYYYPYYYAPTVTIPSEPQEYIEKPRSEEPSAPLGVWYYCPGSKTYYPCVKECPDGWQTVPAQPPSEPRR